MRNTTNTPPKVITVALLALVACKEKAPPAAPGGHVVAKPSSVETTTTASKGDAVDGMWGIRATKPLTLAELKKQLPDATFGGLMPANRGAGKKMVEATRADTTVDFFFESPSKPFVWFEVAHQPICVDGICVGDPLAKATAHAGSTCTANHDGQGFSATFSCGAGTLLVQATLPDDVRQEHPLGQATAPFPTPDLVAANATTAGFVWVAPSQTWTPDRYDEGDR